MDSNTTPLKSEEHKETPTPITEDDIKKATGILMDDDVRRFKAKLTQEDWAIINTILATSQQETLERVVAKVKTLRPMGHNSHPISACAVCKKYRDSLLDRLALQETITPTKQ